MPSIARRRAVAIHRSGRALLVTAIALGMAACSTSVASQPLAQVGGTAPPAASPAASGGQASASPTPNVHVAPELEARLPDSIGGVPMSKFSMGGADFMAGGSTSGQAQLESMLQQLGRTDADLLVADTYDPTGASAEQAAIFEVKGADPARLLGLWVAAQTTITHDETRVSNVVVDGRHLTRLEDFTSEPSRVTYAWSSGDSIVIVAASTDAVLKELLAKIPA